MEDFLTLLLAGISVGAVYGLIAIGLNLTFWTTKTMNFGQGSVMMLCAMLTATMIARGWPQVLSILAARRVHRSSRGNQGNGLHQGTYRRQLHL